VGRLLVVSEHFPDSSSFSLLVGDLRLAAYQLYCWTPSWVVVGCFHHLSSGQQSAESVVAESSHCSCSAFGAVAAEWFRRLCCASRSSGLRRRRIPVDVLSNTRLQLSRVLPVDCYEFSLGRTDGS